MSQKLLNRNDITPQLWHWNTVQWCRNWGGQGGHWPPQYLAHQLTLFQPGIIPTYYYWHPQCFSPSGITAFGTFFPPGLADMVFENGWAWIDRAQLTIYFLTDLPISFSQLLTSKTLSLNHACLKTKSFHRLSY